MPRACAANFSLKNSNVLARSIFDVEITTSRCVGVQDAVQHQQCSQIYSPPCPDPRVLYQTTSATIVCEAASPVPPPPTRTMALTVENRRDLAALASSASLGKMPKPPPGYKQSRTKGFPLPDLDTLFGHVLNALGPELATAKNRPPSEGGGANGGESVLSKRARDPSADEGGGKRRCGVNANGAKSDGASSEQGRSPMDMGAAGGKGDATAKNSEPGAAASAEVEPEPAGPPSDPLQEGLDVSKKAFSRVLGVWEGVAMEGKRGLHQRVVARLGRILAEAEAAALAQEVKASESEVGSARTVRFARPSRRRLLCGV